MNNQILDGVHLGDCLELCRRVPDNHVDLIYMDPPYGSKTTYNEFHDKFNTVQYMDYMKPRLEECERVLSQDGTIYLHVNQAHSHRLRVFMDDLFGEKAYGNQIILPVNTGRGSQWQPRNWAKGYYVLLRYRRGEHVFNPEFRPVSQEYLYNSYKHVDPDTGERYRLEYALHTQTDDANPGMYYEWNGYNPERGWSVSRKRLEEMHAKGWLDLSGKFPMFRRYMKDRIGYVLSDVWEDMVFTPNNERLKYPTQKPLKLLRRIVQSSSNPGQLVMDPFCGTGTTLAAATELGRRVMGFDINERAIELTRERMAGSVNLFSNLE